MTVAIDAELRRARRVARLSQGALAERSGLHIETIIALESGRGTVPSLVTALATLKHRLSIQYDPARTLGQHIDEYRRKLGLSHARLAILSGVSRPSVVQVLSDHGQVNTLTLVMTALYLPFHLVTASAAVETPVARPRSHIRRIIQGDCRETLTTMEAGSVDVVITSPPYAAGKAYDDVTSIKDYTAFAETWISLLPRVLSPRGSVWINLGYIKTEFGGALPLTYLYHPIVERHGLHIMQEIVWHYEGGMRYVNRFSHRTERWMWLVRDPADFTFNLDPVRDPAANRTRDRRNHPLGKNPTDYWYYDRVSGGRGASREKTEHPCQFPTTMIERILIATSRLGDVVLDPFAGAGSTAVAAERLGRGYVMIERDEGYVRTMTRRLG